MYILQFHTEQRYESPKRWSYRVMEKPDTLHKIKNCSNKDTEYKYFGC